MQGMTTDKAKLNERAIAEPLAAACAVALKELERDGLDAWAAQVNQGTIKADDEAKYTAGRLVGLETAIRILAAVADGETGINVAAAVYLDPIDLITIQREAWFSEDVLFFTNCEVCNGQLVGVGGGDGAPSACAACADPIFGDEADEKRQETFGHIARTLFMTARNALGAN